MRGFLSMSARRSAGGGGGGALSLMVRMSSGGKAHAAGAQGVCGGVMQGSKASRL